jgi:hypothetical protein
METEKLAENRKPFGPRFSANERVCVFGFDEILKPNHFLLFIFDLKLAEFDRTLAELNSESPHLFNCISCFDKLVVVIVNQALHTLIERAYFLPNFSFSLQQGSQWHLTQYAVDILILVKLARVEIKLRIAHEFRILTRLRFVKIAQL